MTTVPCETAAVSAGLQRGLALLVAAAYFMEILDGTVIAPAAPAIAAEFGVAPVDVNVAITAYALTLAVLIPVSGWLASRFGVRRVFLTALLVFTVASAGCAAAPNLPVLTGTRVLQGIGGALMVPVGRLAILRTTSKTDLVRAIAYLTWPALLAPVVAPLVGGVLAEHASWRWIFLINLPLGVVALIVARRLVPDLREPAPGPLDRVGFLLIAAGVAAVIVAAEGLRTGFGVGVAVALAVAVLGIAAAIRHLLRTPDPLVDLRLLRVRTFRVTVLSGSAYRAVITAIPFLLPLFFQVGFGWSATQAGFAMMALFAGNVGIKPATTPLMRRFGIRTVMLASIVVGAACLVGMALLADDLPLVAVLALLALSGVARSTGFTAYNSVAFADVDPADMNHASTLQSTLQELGVGLGVAAGALLVRFGDAVGVVSGAAGPFRVAFVLLAVLLVIPAIEGARLPRTAGDTVTGRA
ncbi:drug resistance transporter, EmrB/QacA subfamily [Cryptosporangium aurantiacum]|uniref:Drug resistance transporter, EmrB/QacA subfamily n=1 Tax=Cryptosporangium aurantiacum TaxID=134849 RepID=A0A1M7TWH5_9ACTN|nr:drug resistance transporter, EmrB/QacA subfamily [Cryptosporangium aurantiacum]